MGKILVVDDDSLSREFVTELLEARGYQVVAAENAEDALQTVERETPALILMDVLLPQMDGLEATRKLKADPSSRHIPVIATTGLTMRGDHQRILEAGYSAHLVKPLDIDQLLQLLEEYLPSPAASAQPAPGRAVRSASSSEGGEGGDPRD